MLTKFALDALLLGTKPGNGSLVALDLVVELVVGTPACVAHGAFLLLDGLHALLDA